MNRNKSARTSPSKQQLRSLSTSNLTLTKVGEFEVDRASNILIHYSKKFSDTQISVPVVKSLVDMCFSDLEIPSPDTFRKKIVNEHNKLSRSASEFRIRKIEVRQPNSMPEIHEREEQASVTSIEARNNLNQPSPREETVQSKTKINTSLLSSTEDLSKLRIRITKRGGQSKSANPRRSSPHPVKIEETQPRVISLRIPDFYKIDNDFKNPISIAPKYGKGPMADVSYMSPRKKSIPKRSSIKGFNALETVSVIKPKKTTQATDAKSPMAPRHKTKYSGAKINPGKEFIGDTFSAQCHHVLNPSWEEKLLMKINYNPNQTIYKSYGDIKNMLDTNYMLRRSASKAIFQSLMNKTARS